MNARVAFVALLSTVLVSCGAPEEAAAPQHSEWIIQTHVAFLEADAKTIRSLPKEPLRLWMPFVVGDIYGSPNAGEIVPVTLKPDMSFRVNLNEAIAGLEKSLIPTEFSQHWMAIEPANARIARLSPFVMPEDGIVPVGTTEWLDEETGVKLMLIYVDRPSHVRGEIVYEGRNLRFDIEAKQAGFLWIYQPDGSGIYRATPRPAKVVLAVMPNS
jgi:hypothetical protein